MQVDPAQASDREQFGRENLTVGRCHQEVGSKPTDLLQALGRVHILWLEDRDPVAPPPLA